MEKGKIFTGVLAVGLVASLVGNVYLWNSLNQKDTEYIATMANLEEELTQSKENQTTLQQQLEQTKADLDSILENPQGDIVVKEELPDFDIEVVYNEETGIYEPVYIPVGGSDTDPSKEGNPLEGMTPEEVEAWMKDTSDAPKPGDPIPEDNNQGNQGNQGNTGGNQGNTGGNHGGLTDEQYQELLKIMDSLGGADPGDPRYHEGGTGSQGGPGSINWDK